MKKIKYIEIKKKLEENSINFNCKLSSKVMFEKIKTLSNATSEDLTFFSNKKYLNELKITNAKACIIEKQFIHFLPKNCEPIIVDNPYLVLALLTNLFNKKIIRSNGIISKDSKIHSNAKIYSNVQIDPFSIISENVKIHDNVFIGSNVYIGPNVVIEENSIIHDHVSISNSIIMQNCEIKSGARIGGDGFGFEEKSKSKVYHSGNVIIKNNSSIGANTTIDRAVFDSTIIGQFSNIDNLVQIAHNVVIGDYAIIAAQVGIAGSTTIGNYIKIGGQAGVSGHLNIGNNVTIAGKSGVTKNLSDNIVVAGFPAKDINLWKKEIIKNSYRK